MHVSSEEGTQDVVGPRHLVEGSRLQHPSGEGPENRPASQQGPVEPAPDGQVVGLAKEPRPLKKIMTVVGSSINNK